MSRDKLLVVIVASLVGFTLGCGSKTPRGGGGGGSESGGGGAKLPGEPGVAPGGSGSGTPAPTDGRQPTSAGAELDTLLALLGQPGVVNNQPLRSMGEVRAQENAKYIRGEFISQTARAKSDLERLSRSSTGEVAEALRRLKPVFEMYDQAAATEKRAQELISKLRKETAQKLEGTTLFLSDFLKDLNLDDSDLQELKFQGKITQREIDSYRQVQKQANANRQTLAEWAREENKIEAATSQKTYRLRNQAELRKNNVAAEVLAPALRARAGGERKSALQVKWGLYGDRSEGFTFSSAKINIRSSAAEELTRLTLLFDFRTPQGSRYAMLYIPKLPPNGGGSFEPVRLSWLYLNNPPKEAPNDLAPITLESTRVRYSAWCDQFRAEGLEPTAMSSREEMVNDTRLLALLPGLAYVSQAGQVLHVNPEAAKAPARPKGIIKGTSNPAPYLAEYEPEGRYELIFKKLTPSGRDYEVELELVDQANKSKSQLLRGVATVPAVKFAASDKRLSLKVTVGSQEMQMELHGDGYEGPLWWTGKGEGSGRKFAPEPVPVPGSPDAVAKERLRSAMALSVERKYDEAKQAYEQIDKDYPNTTWAMAARRSIGGLRELKESHRKLDETLKTQKGAK